MPTLLLVASAAAQHWLDAPREGSSQPGDQIRAWADFDGDGRLDLLITRPRPGISGIAGFWIAFATSDGRYLPGPTLPPRPTGYQGETYCLAGDLTGDGLPDVVMSFRELTSNPGSGILLYRNLGGGTLAAPMLTAGGVPWSHGVLSDWNHDGVPELVELHLGGTAHGGVRRWSWQNGALVGSNEVPAPGYTNQLSSGDVTGDGLPDVVCGGAEDGSIYVFPTLPGGNLGAPVLHPIGTLGFPPGRVPTCADLDGDGDQDIVVGWRGLDSFHVNVAIVRNLGAGQLQVEAPVVLDASPGMYWNGRIQVGDWDGDGDLDLLFGHELLYFFDNRGVAGFQFAGVSRVARSSSGQPQVLDGSEGVGSADVDGDQRPDYVTGRVIVHGTGRFASPFFPTTLSSIVRALDWDGDGDLDILDSGSALAVNQGSNAWRVMPRLFPAPPANFFYVEAYGCGDFDGNGQPDLLVTYFQRLSLFNVVFQGMRRLERTPAGDLADLGLAGPAGVSLGSWPSFLVEQRDLDGDGDVDLAVPDGWWENAGNGTFQVFHGQWVGVPALVADVDGDGRPDVLTRTAVGSGTEHRLYRNLVGGFVPTALAVDAAGPAYCRGDLLDLDGDGDLDFVTGLSTGPMLVLRENQAGVFAAPVTLPVLAAYPRVWAEDVDGDGLRDLLAAPLAAGGSTYGESAQVWRRLGPGLQYDAPRAWLSPEPTAELADLDGDGDLELFGRGAFLASGRFHGAAAGRFLQYGDAVAGPSGVPALLGLAGPARAGGSVALRIVRAPGQSVAVLGLGSSRADLANVPLPGLTLRVFPVLLALALPLGGAPGVPGAGAAQLPVVVPPELRGVTVFHQAFVLDGATLGATNGLEIEYGW